MGRLEGKVALISGGARGQGECETRLFSREGCSVVFGDILDEEGRRVEAEIVSSGGTALYVHLDVTSERDWKSAVDVAERRFGRLDILINNAGVSFRHPELELTREDWERTMSVNSTGVFLGTKCAVPALKRAGGGSIVNISSIAGIVGRPLVSPAYAASKGAVTAFTKLVAARFAEYGIRCNSVHPGPIDTEMIRSPDNEVPPEARAEGVPLGRLGQSEDVAFGALYLASDESSFVTAAELVIDGGVTGVRP